MTRPSPSIASASRPGSIPSRSWSVPWAMGRFEPSPRISPSERTLRSTRGPRPRRASTGLCPPSTSPRSCARSISGRTRIPSKFRRWSAADIAAAGITAGGRFETLPSDQAATLTRLGRGIVRYEEFWQQRLRQLAPVELPSGYRGAGTQRAESRATATLIAPPLPTPAGEPQDFLMTALMLYLARITGRASFDIGFGHAGLEESLAGCEQFFALQVPVYVALDLDGSLRRRRPAVLN